MEVHVRSPSVKIHRAANYDIRSLPVFGDHDKVMGKVLVDLGLCCTPGRLTISVRLSPHPAPALPRPRPLLEADPVRTQLQGSFLFTSPNVDPSASQDYADNLREEKGRHVFFTVSETRMTGELDSPRSATSLRDAFTASVRGRRERRPSQTGVRGALRPFPFAFEIPRPEHAGLSGQELPPTFSSVTAGECGPRGRTGVERSEVSYSVTALWEAVDGSDRLLYVLHRGHPVCYRPWLTFSHWLLRSVDAPIIYQPDLDFQSLDGMPSESWLEIPLKSDRSLPFTCAVSATRLSPHVSSSGQRDRR